MRLDSSLILQIIRRCPATKQLIGRNKDYIVTAVSYKLKYRKKTNVKDADKVLTFYP